MSQLFYNVIEDEYVLTNVGIICVVLIILILFALALLFYRRFHKPAKDRPKHTPVRQIVFSGAAMALGIITSEFIPTITMPMGGSITLFSMFFIVLIGYWYGLGAGLSTALAYGLLQFVLDPKFISIPQILLDYVFAFGALGLSGLFANRKHGLVWGYLTGVAGRFFFSWLAGFLIWGMYAPQGTPAALYSLTYQASYLVPEAILTLIILVIPPVQNGLNAVKKLT
ncbi:MAG TPA: energy-coupled thiamine transporter ThiT [Lachnospiraceae bacterium]|nr:energy-coupled thiamine transporter ThiT [Lachnospiraceae bacterium]HPF29254.1 energy-coupled thiamine transporter ThiT [Lachnospiraceae bacterium]